MLLYLAYDPKMIEQMNSGFDNIVGWCPEDDFKLNSGKCSLLQLPQHNTVQTVVDVMLGGESLYYVSDSVTTDNSRWRIGASTHSLCDEWHDSGWNFAPTFTKFGISLSFCNSTFQIWLLKENKNIYFLLVGGRGLPPIFRFLDAKSNFFLSSHFFSEKVLKNQQDVHFELPTHFILGYVFFFSPIGFYFLKLDKIFNGTFKGQLGANFELLSMFLAFTVLLILVKVSLGLRVL